MTQRTGRPKGHMARCDDCGTSGRLWLHLCLDLETSMHHGEDMQYCTDGQTYSWYTSPQEGAHPGDWSGIGRPAKSTVHEKNDIERVCLVESGRSFLLESTRFTGKASGWALQTLTIEQTTSRTAGRGLNKTKRQQKSLSQSTRQNK